MTEIIVTQMDNDASALLVYKGDADNADIFRFSSEDAAVEACEMCETLAEYEVDVLDGKIGNCPAVVLIDTYSEHDAYIFTFRKDSDLSTAFELADRYCELKDENDDAEETDSDE